MQWAATKGLRAQQQVNQAALNTSMLAWYRMDSDAGYPYRACTLLRCPRRTMTSSACTRPSWQSLAFQ